MSEQDYKNISNSGGSRPDQGPRGGLDAAGRSLYEALRVSFIILKVIMVILIAVFFLSGFRTVGSDEQALVLRFGRIKGAGEERVLGPGLHWVFPYPIDETVRIAAAKKINLGIDKFWYFQDLKDTVPKLTESKPRPPSALEPVKEGYCITRSEKQDEVIIGSTGSDYNIVHCKWQLTYKIDDPERFFRNNYIENVRPSQNYTDVMEESIKPLLESLVEDCIVTAMVNYTIDEALVSQDRIPRHVEKLLQQKLDEIEGGIAVVSVQLTDITWPRQVEGAFLSSIKASQTRQKIISEAKGYAENTLNEAAGPVAAELFLALHNDGMSEQDKEFLWSQLAGAAQEKIAEAKAYRTRVVEAAKANAEYLHRILPEYRKRPELVVQKIYQDAVEEVLNNADEKMIIQPTEGTKGKEIRILLNRDPSIKPKSEEGQKQ